MLYRHIFKNFETCMHNKTEMHRQNIIKHSRALKLSQISVIEINVCHIDGA